MDEGARAAFIDVQWDFNHARVMRDAPCARLIITMSYKVN